VIFPLMRKESVPDRPENEVDLKSVIGSILRALQQAKQMGDLESASLLESYAKEKRLASFSVPAFSIADVEIELRFAVVGAPGHTRGEENASELKIAIGAEALKGLDPAHLQTIKFRLAPVPFGAMEGEKGESD